MLKVALYDAYGMTGGVGETMDKIGDSKYSNCSKPASGKEPRRRSPTANEDAVLKPNRLHDGKGTAFFPLVIDLIGRFSETARPHQHSGFQLSHMQNVK